MEKYKLEMIRRDKIQIELDESYFDEKWFEDFRKDFYNLESLKDLAEHIAFNVIHNNSTSIEGIGIPLREGEKPYWIKAEEEEYLNKHVNVIFNSYDTEAEFE